MRAPRPIVVAARPSLALARMAWGGTLVTVPGLLLGTLTGRPPTRTQTTILRVLGTRHLLQGGVELARPTRTLARAGAAVDLVHAATCAGAAALSPTWRRPALFDGTGAVLFAGGGLASAYLPARPSGRRRGIRRSSWSGIRRGCPGRRPARSRSRRA